MNRVLVANRGEIAVRIMRTCSRMGLETVAVYADPDRDALHVAMADTAFALGGEQPSDSYLDAERLLSAAAACGADAVHPGYGFLSEDPGFARAVQSAGLTWVGPPPEAIEAMGSKAKARDIATAHGVPVLPALVLTGTPDNAAQAGIRQLGLPLLLKAAAGGGGIGMRVIEAGEHLADVLATAREQAQRQFGDPTLLLERVLEGARHVEVQVLADGHGNLVHLFERDCSLQRRRQKLIEEAPAPGLSEPLRESLREAALALSRAVDYRGAGTVEFLVHGGDFYLLEINTRLQVEHGVTEAVTGIDLVECQLTIARGEPLPFRQADITCEGHAVEARLYAEDPAQDFAPQAGRLLALDWPEPDDCRCDIGYRSGDRVGHQFDGLLGKLIVHRADRERASDHLRAALGKLALAGIASNRDYLSALLSSPCWQLAGLHTRAVEEGHADLLARALEQRATHARGVLIAATLWQFLNDPPAADRAPWPGGYACRRSTAWLHGDDPVTVNWRWAAADEFEFADPTARVSLVARDEASLELEVDGHRKAFRLIEDGDRYWVSCRGCGFLQLTHLAGDGATARATNQLHCNSPGPGQVLRVLVEAGQRVSKGDDMLVLESMKMENTLKAAVDAQVRSLEVSDGDLVASGQRLVTMEPVT